MSNHNPPGFYDNISHSGDHDSEYDSDNDPIYEDMYDDLMPDVDNLEDAPWDENIFLDDPPPEDGADGHSRRPDLLEKTNLSQLFGADGPLAQELEGYELRPSQLEMAEAIKRALIAEGGALIEAPTGTGKSIAYLIPAILSGKTVVVATANKSLQSQLYHKDIPFLRKVLKTSISAVVVKGRSNFVCTYKWDDENFQQQRFAFEDREHDQITFIRDWLQTTKTGDVDDLPFMMDSELRPRLVSYSDDCLHSDCRYYHDDCWINKMRDRAAEVQILITNHHLLLNALELGHMGERILPPAAVYVIDEAHQLEQTATSVFEASITDYTVKQLLSRNIFKEHADRDLLDEIEMQNLLAFSEIEKLSQDSSFRIDADLESVRTLARMIDSLQETMKKNNPYGDEKNSGDNGNKKPEFGKDKDENANEQRAMYELAVESLGSTVNSLRAIATNKHDDKIVRYANRVFDRRNVKLEVHAAPIDPAELLKEYLFDPEFDYDDKSRPQSRSVICTSATLATNRHFDHFKARCGIENICEELVLPAVFDYPKQAMLYQPALPAYNYKDADRYYNAVSNEIVRLLEVSRGRALCLFTSWSGLQQVKERLVEVEDCVPIWPLRAQGDAPRDALLAWFKETPYSVLLATRSFWEGVDIPGDDLSLVVLDKMPFPTPSDPLHSARMKAIDDAGQSSFGQYMLPLMTLTLKQGFGRLVRRSTDLGVVAMLDERLTSKGYGRQAREDLPPARFSRKFKDVHYFFRGSLGSEADFGLNVWSWRATGIKSGLKWRWRLLRFQDGKADVDQGSAKGVDGTDEGEVMAAINGLQNLRQRIESAERNPDGFGVEVRAGAEAIALMEAGDSLLVQQWAAECAAWKEVKLIAISEPPLSDAQTDEFGT